MSSKRQQTIGMKFSEETIKIEVPVSFINSESNLCITLSSVSGSTIPKVEFDSVPSPAVSLISSALFSKVAGRHVVKKRKVGDSEFVEEKQNVKKCVFDRECLFKERRDCKFIHYDESMMEFYLKTGLKYFRPNEVECPHERNGGVCKMHTGYVCKYAHSE